MLDFSEKIVNSLINAGAVPSEEKELYGYGIRQGILMVISAATAVLIGVILGMVWQSIIFMLAYSPIRSYAGGYHANTQLTCYLLSIPFMLAALIGIRMIPWNGYLCLIALLCSGVIIGWLAPVEDLNKPLDQREKVVYKRRACAILAVLSGIAILFWFVEMRQVTFSIIMALGLAAVMLILGVFKNSRNVEKKA